MAGPVQPPIFPVMWARDATTSFLRTPEEMLALIEAAGFRTRDWDPAHAAGLRATGPGASYPAQGIQQILMGDELAAIAAAGERNVAEGRIVGVQAVFEEFGRVEAT
jgi:hypothetical protein